MRRAHSFGLAVLAVVAVPSPSAHAQPEPGRPATSAPLPSESDVAPPVLRGRIEATYPPEALRDRIEGVVELELAVDEAGAVVDARVTAPAGHGFDAAAVEAARRFSFEPARKNGAPIRSTVRLAYEFHLPADAPAQPGPDPSMLVIAERARRTIGAPPERNAASESSTGQSELSLRPRYRAEGLLDVVPGLFSVQHAGGGKAQQDFARGFNLDHGTDMAFFVDDVPVNAVSHAHGQGYSDLHFLIPETVERVDSTKGPYAAAVGDFGTAGSTSFRMMDRADESVAKLELAPATGHQRLVVVESPDLADTWRLALAVEVFHENGPFIHSEDFGRLNAYAKATHALDSRSDVSLMAMAYSGSWNMSGVLPARAVCGEGDGTPTPAAYAGSHCISRWDSVDPTQGGSSERIMASLQYRRRFDAHWEAKATAYTLDSNLQLFPNDGIAAAFQPDGVRFGSQIEQDDTRTQSGADVRLTHRAAIFGMPARTTVGLQIRGDAIAAELHRTQARRRLDGADAAIPGPIYDGRIDEVETGVFVQQELRFTPWLRFVLGLRSDRVDAAVSNESPTAVDRVSGYNGQAQLSPKMSVVASPRSDWDLFANYGRGFHSNDARTISGGASTTLIAGASGCEAGTTVRPLEGLSVSAVAFLVDLASELTIDGDTASTSPAGATRRYGAEVTARYEFDRRIYADAAFTAAHGRFTDAADIAAGTLFLPDAPIRTFSASLGARQPLGRGWTLQGDATVRSMSERYADQGPTPLVETGWTVVDAGVGARWRFLSLRADLLNVADVKWREGQFEVNSRLPLEGPRPPAGISLTPGLPRTFMTHAAVYW